MAEFKSAKDPGVRERWSAAAREALAYGIWQRAAVPLSDQAVLVRLRQRYPMGVPQGELTLRDVTESREKLSTTVWPSPVHEVSLGFWCACVDGLHDGNSRTSSPITVELDRLILGAGFRIDRTQ
jgi:hypothetical protein